MVQVCGIATAELFDGRNVSDTIEMTTKITVDNRHSFENRIKIRIFALGHHPLTREVWFNGITGWGTDLEIINVSGRVGKHTYFCPLMIEPYSLYIEAVPEQEEVLSAYRDKTAIALCPKGEGEELKQLPAIWINPKILQWGLYGIHSIEGTTREIHGTDGYLDIKAEIPTRGMGPILKLKPPYTAW